MDPSSRRAGFVHQARIEFFWANNREVGYEPGLRKVKIPSSVAVGVREESRKSEELMTHRCRQGRDHPNRALSAD